jgi:hypothetical protein
MPVQTPFDAPFVSLFDFGATRNDPTDAAKAANSDAFDKAQDAMTNDSEIWGHPIFVPSGRFYLGRDLHISKSIHLFGTGLQGESVLVLPDGASIIIDPSTNDRPTRSGNECVIRDLQIHCDPRWTAADGASVDLVTLEGRSTKSPGILMRAGATIQHVLIRGFWGTGIAIFSDDDANANQWRIHDVYINECGGHGIHVDGGETQGGFCDGAKIISIGGTGIYESSFGGNTWVGCYVEEAGGRGYLADSVGQPTFVGCFAEGQHPSRLAAGGVVWVGGGDTHGFEDSNAALIAEGFALVHPFQVPNQLNLGIRLLLGYGDNSDALYGWQADAEAGNFWLFRWLNDLKAWSTEMGNTFPTSQRVNYQTALGHVRGDGLQGFPSLLLGPVETDPITGKGKAVRVETSPISGAAPTSGPYQRGDLVFNAPSDYDQEESPQFVGWVCVGDSDPMNLVWKRFGKIEA